MSWPWAQEMRVDEEGHREREGVKASQRPGSQRAAGRGCPGRRGQVPVQGVSLAGLWGDSPEVHQKDMLNLLQDLQLPEYIADLVTLDALLLVHVFHGIHLLCVPLLHDAHLQAKAFQYHTWSRPSQPPPPPMQH